MPNRAERRREKRESKKKPDILNINNVKEAIRVGLEAHMKRKTIRDEAIMMASGPVVKAIFAGVITILAEDYGFTSDQCLDVLSKLDEKSALCLDSEEMIEEAFQKTGIRIRLNDAVNRIEKVDEAYD